MSSIAIMSHNYNTRTKNNKEYNMLVALANLETKLLDGFSSLKDEVINLEDLIIKNLQEENTKFRSRVELLENKLKVGFSPSKKNCVLCFIESSLKIMKNVFYFVLKALFVLKIFRFLS